MKMFINSLEGDARQLYKTLHVDSIASLKDFHDAFHYHCKIFYSTKLLDENFCNEEFNLVIGHKEIDYDNDIGEQEREFTIENDYLDLIIPSIQSQNFIEQKVIFDEEVQSFESLHVQAELLAVESFSPSFVKNETPHNIVPINSFSDVSIVFNKDKETKEYDHDEIIVPSLYQN